MDASILESYRTVEDVRYLNSGKWKCTQSSTGSHIWKIEDYLKHSLIVSQHTCQACKMTKLIVRKIA